MSRIKIISMLAVALVAIAVGLPVFAHHGHHHHHGVSVRFVFGGPAFYYPRYYYPPYYPPYYYPPYYYYPRVVTVPAAPVYVERGDSYAPSAPSAQTQGYWHYCPEAKAYYPYVKQCAGGWQKHTPTPPPGG